MRINCLPHAAAVAFFSLSCVYVSAGDLTAEQRKVAAARKRLESTLDILNNKTKGERLTKLYQEHAELKAKAHEWLFGNKEYATPAKARTGWVPGKDTQPGHDEMEKRVSVLIVKHNELIATLCAALRFRFEVVGVKKMTTTPLTANIPKVYQYGIASATSGLDYLLKDYAKKYEKYQAARKAMEAAKGADTEETKEKPILKALALLAQGKYAEARAAGAQLSGLEKDFFWHACAYYLVAWNRKNPGGHAPNEMKGTELINVYRIALGIRPLAHHPKLHEMAKDYSQEMDKHGFFGHVHPKDPSRKTHGKRAQRVGYSGVDGENCASGAAGEQSVWRWRADAGHHRGMIKPSSNEIGLASASKAVLNTGRGGHMPVTQLFSSSRKKGKRR